MTTLLFGANGQIGSALRWTAFRRGIELIGFGHRDGDITNMTTLAQIFSAHRPSLVINCAAYTNVDGAEKDRDLAIGINGIGAGNLAALSAETGIPMLHLSTDYVFNGASDAPYREDHQTGPINAYGASKLDGERRVAALSEQHIILRTAWVFGAHGNNFVKTMLRLADRQTGGTINVVNDQLGGPTEAGDIADCLLSIRDRLAADEQFGDWGIYHYGGQPPVTWYDFAKTVLKGRPDVAVNPVPTSDFPRPAARPAYSMLDCDKIGRTFGIAPPDWRIGLTRVLDQIGAGSG